MAEWLSRLDFGLVLLVTLAAPIVAVCIALVAWLQKEAHQRSRVRVSPQPREGLSSAPPPSNGAAIPVMVDRVRFFGYVTRFLSGISLAASILLAAVPRTQWFSADITLVVTRLNIRLDGLSIYFLLLVNIVAFFASWHTVDFIKFSDTSRASLQTLSVEGFHFYFNLFHLTMLIVPIVDNLVILWMAIELTTLASTMLVSFRRSEQRAIEAAWKYIMITTTGIVLALFGTILLADAIPTDLADTLDGPMRWSVLASASVVHQLDEALVLFSFLFILLGYGTKAGLAPMHTWLPDGHGEAPAPVSALLSGVLLKCALYAILRFYTIASTNLENAYPGFTTNLLLFAGLLSLVLATPFIIKRNRFKRVLAYHSLEHMGIITFGIGVGGQLAIFGALLHALNHALVKALMFLSFENVRLAFADRRNMGDRDEDKIHDLLHLMPLTSILLLFGGVGLVGSPPFSIFYSEMIIIWAALQQVLKETSHGGLSGLVLATSLTLFLITVSLIFGGLVRHLARMLLYRGARPIVVQPEQTSTTLGHDVTIIVNSASSSGKHQQTGWKEYDNIKRLWLLFLLLGVTALFGVWLPNVGVDFPRLISEGACIVEHGPQEWRCLP